MNLHKKNQLEHQQYDNMVKSLELDTLDKRLLERLLTYATKAGFDRNINKAWHTRQGLTILRDCAKTIFDHLFEEKIEDQQFNRLEQLIRKWNYWLK